MSAPETPDLPQSGEDETNIEVSGAPGYVITIRSDRASEKSKHGISRGIPSNLEYALACEVRDLRASRAQPAEPVTGGEGEETDHAFALRHALDRLEQVQRYVEGASPLPAVDAAVAMIRKALSHRPVELSGNPGELEARPVEQEAVAWSCKTCNSPRPNDPCWKCGSALTKPADGWEWPGLPDIDRIRALARDVGYAIGVHGSLERDLDLIAVPWVEDAVTPLALAQHIAAGLSGEVVDYKTQDKPCGRWSCNIHTPDWTKLIDLSVMPPCQRVSGHDRHLIEVGFPNGMRLTVVREDDYDAVTVWSEDAESIFTSANVGHINALSAAIAHPAPADALAVSEVVAKWRASPDHAPIAAGDAADALSQGERERLADAYIAGAMSVHEYWTKNPGEAPSGDPEFGEAAGDYAYSILALIDRKAGRAP